MVPIVDLSSATAGERLAEGLAALGFVQLVGHGVEPSTAQELRSTCDQFFALDEAIKRRHVHPSPEANRGFRSRGSEALSYSLGTPSPPDLFESFNCGDDAIVTGHALLQPTPWPDDAVAGFSTIAHRYVAQMQTLASRLDSMIDNVLGTSFAETSGQGPDTLACIDYRPGPDGGEAVEPSQQRMGAHSDYTTFTILNADPVRGLQIVTDDGWHDVIPEAGALLLNVGDLLAMATNDSWPSTLHRVVPMEAGCEPNRRSVAYFHYPNLGTTVAPLPRFGAARYEPVTVEAHLLGKLTAPKTHAPATSVSTTAGRGTS